MSDRALEGHAPSWPRKYCWFRWARLRGTAALQVVTDQQCPIEPWRATLRRGRGNIAGSVGPGCEGPQPSRSLLTNNVRSSPGGPRSAVAAEMLLVPAGPA